MACLIGFFTLAIVLSLLIYIGRRHVDAFDPKTSIIMQVNVPPIVLAVEHLHISHAAQVLVEDLNFKLHAGETIAIVGESGSW